MSGLTDKNGSDLQKQFSELHHPAYSAALISKRHVADSKSYFDLLLGIRLELVRARIRNGRVLDLCCSNGEHLFALHPLHCTAIGLDFSIPYVKSAQAKQESRSGTNLAFSGGDATNLPFKGASFDVIYSFSSLYYIPDLGSVFREISRTLKLGGFCVVDLGNAHSLNALVCKAYPELLITFYVDVAQMKTLLGGAGLRIVIHRAFQILPYWGEKPKWLKLLLFGGWKRIGETIVGGRMIDEWISSLPILRRFAFRHVFVCVKD